MFYSEFDIYYSIENDINVVPDYSKTDDYAAEYIKKVYYLNVI